MKEISEEEYANFRKNRVKRLKKTIVSIVLILILIPDVLCGFLLFKVVKLNNYVDEIYSSLNEIKNYKEISREDDSLFDTKEDTILASDKNEVKQEVYFRNITDAEAYEGYQRIYLTFDDGPGIYTNEILDILNEYNVKATFFVIAKDNCDDKYQRILNEGHTLGLHTYSHDYSDVYSDVNGFTKDVEDISDFIYNITGERCKFYRFPGGSSNTIFKGDKNELLSVLNDRDLTFYDWNVTSGDATYGGLSKYQIASNVIKGIGSKEEAVVLMHDANDKHSTVEALRIIIETLQNKENVIFLPITENTEPVQHIRYESEK